MKKLIVPAGLFFLVACGAPDPADEVRKLRRQYKLRIDLTVNSQLEATYEIEVQNLSGGKNLQEITVWVRLLEDQEKALWYARKELDVSDVGNYATKKFSFKETIPGEAEAYQFFDVIPAPDDPDSNFKEYKEFRRVATE